MVLNLTSPLDDSYTLQPAIDGQVAEGQNVVARARRSPMGRETT
jgi:hypothetical protein